MMRGFGLLSLAAVLVAASGCALLSKSDPLTPRYFSAEPADARSEKSSAPPRQRVGNVASTEPELRLGRVTSASYLGERLVYRSSSYELGFYEDRRWTEKPEMYFRRSLARALFETGGFRHVVSGSGPTLDVELVELAELKGPTHTARATANFVLYDPHSVRTEATVTVELPIPAAPQKEQAAAAVGALSQALAGAVNQIASRVSGNLAATDTNPGVVGAK